MRVKQVLLTLLVLFLVQAVWCQSPFPQHYFRSPVGYEFTLAGSFGELRRNHFHSGIDIRTGGEEGKPVYAAADGYISRIFVAPGGFGKALYLAHPNGYTTVYGHLKAFGGTIAAWVRTKQYRQETFALDTEVPAGLIRVRKGELIAYSGNSGASAGPHLHFEIRDSRTQETIDPLEFGLIAPDLFPPQISWIKIYPLGENSLVNFADKPVMLPVICENGDCRLKLDDTVMVSGNIIFGLETSERYNGSGFKTGVNAIRLLVDGRSCYEQNLDRFSFSQTRYANSLMDYPAFVLNRRKIQRSYIAPNNKLNINGTVVNRGIVNFMDRRPHYVQYLVHDVFGNKARLDFWVKSHPPLGHSGRPWTEQPEGTQLFSFSQDNHFIRPDIRFEVPGEALYEDLDFEYSVSPPAPGCFSMVHHLQDQYTPLQTWCTLSIRAGNLPNRLQSKVVIVALETGNHPVSRGGKFENGFVTTQIRDFGDYSVMADTVGPLIRPVNIFSGKKVNRQYAIKVKISDNLSGIKAYRGKLNGKWILMDWDEKNQLLTYGFDEYLKPGKNLFVLVVTDAVGNSSRYEATLIR